MEKTLIKHTYVSLCQNGDGQKLADFLKECLSQSNFPERNQCIVWAANHMSAERLCGYLGESSNLNLRNGAMEALSLQGESIRKALKKVILGKDPQAAMFGVQVFGRTLKFKNDRWLVNLLNHADSNLRAASIEACGSSGAKAAEKKLIAMLDVQDPWVVSHAIEALGKLRSKSCIPHLHRILLRGDYAGVVLVALGRIATERAIGIFVAWFVNNVPPEDLEMDLALKCLAAILKTTGGDLTPQNRKRLKSRVESLALKEGLECMLRSEDLEDVLCAAEIICGLKLSSSYEKLLLRLIDTQDLRCRPEDRLEIASVFYRHRKSLVKELRSFIHHAQPELRLAIIYADIYPITDKDLHTYLLDNDEKVRIAIYERMSSKSGKWASLLLQNLHESSYDECRALIAVLARQSHIPLLPADLHPSHRSLDYILAVLEILENTKTKKYHAAILGLFGAATSILRKKALRTLVLSKYVDRVSLLKDALLDPSDDVIREAILLCGNVTNKGLLKFVKPFIDANPVYKIEWCKALARSTSPLANDFLLAQYETASHFEKLEILCALHDKKNDKVAKLLKKEITSMDLEIRRAAAKKLLSFKAIRLNGALGNLCQDSDWFVRTLCLLHIIKHPQKKHSRLVKSLCADEDSMISHISRSVLAGRKINRL